MYHSRKLLKKTTLRPNTGKIRTPDITSETYLLNLPALVSSRSDTNTGICNGYKTGILRQCHIEHPWGYRDGIGDEVEGAFEGIGGIAGDDDLAAGGEVAVVAYVVGSCVGRWRYAIGIGACVIGDIQLHGGRYRAAVVGSIDDEVHHAAVIGRLLLQESECGIGCPANTIDGADDVYCGVAVVVGLHTFAIGRAAYLFAGKRAHTNQSNNSNNQPFHKHKLLVQN